MRSSVLALIVAALAVVAGGCGSLLPTAPGSPEFGQTIDVVNDTKLAVTIVLNDEPVGTIDPHTGASILGPRLPPKPWKVVAVTASGRELLRFTVAPGQVTSTTGADGTTTMTSAGSRVDLTCGRLDVTVGSPMLGPPPAQNAGVAGDCVP